MAASLQRPRRLYKSISKRSSKPDRHRMMRARDRHPGILDAFVEILVRTVVIQPWCRVLARLLYPSLVATADGKALHPYTTGNPIYTLTLRGVGEHRRVSRSTRRPPLGGLGCSETVAESVKTRYRRKARDVWNNAPAGVSKVEIDDPNATAYVLSVLTMLVSTTRLECKGSVQRISHCAIVPT